MNYSKEVDKKWQGKWKKEGLYKYNKSSKYLYHPDDSDILMPGMVINIYLKDYDLEFRKLYFYGNPLNRNITLQKKK